MKTSTKTPAILPKANKTCTSPASQEEETPEEQGITLQEALGWFTLPAHFLNL